MAKLDELLYQTIMGVEAEVGDVSLPISADGVTDSNTRVMVSPQQRGQIDTLASDINTHSQRLITLESEIQNLDGLDEKVKINSNDTAGYLEDKLDNSTLVVMNNKVVAMGLEGLTSTISELNLLTGATSNIQSQINALSNVGNFTTTVPTYADLATLTPSVNDLVIVLTDENENDTPSTIYIYNGTDWVYSGKFEGGQIRDFVANPIILETEVTGILSKELYEKQDASETPFVDSSGNIISTNTQDAIKELFQFADSGKRLIANAIGYPVTNTDDFNTIVLKYQSLITDIANELTNKGVITYPYNKLNELPSRIKAIPNITLEGEIKRVSKVNVTAPYELKVSLDTDLAITDIVTTALEFEQGDTGVVHYDLDFNNGDSSNFVDNENVEFDGIMKLKNDLEIQMNKIDAWTEEGNVYRQTITPNKWLELDNVKVIKKLEVL